MAAQSACYLDEAVLASEAEEVGVGKAVASTKVAWEVGAG